MDAEGKVENGCAFGQLEQIAFRCEDKDFIFIEFELELIHHFEVASGMFEGFADGGEPFVESAFALHALVSPMGCKATFGNVVHAFGADLHFHPFAFRSHHGGMERFIAIAFRHTQPVAEPFRIGHIHIRHDGIHLPAFLLFLFIFRIQNDADSEQVVNSLERTFLFLHLLVDGVDGLGASLHVELQAGIFQLLLNRLDKGSNVSVARSLGFVQLLLDMIIHFFLCILQRKVLQFRFQLVKPQLVGEGSIQVGGFVGNLLTGFFIRGVLDLAHQVHTVGYHDENHTHVFGKG